MALMYKDKSVVTIDKEQVATMSKAGWSTSAPKKATSKKATSPVEAAPAPTPVEAAPRTSKKKTL